MNSLSFCPSAPKTAPKTPPPTPQHRAARTIQIGVHSHGIPDTTLFPNDSATFWMRKRGRRSNVGKRTAIVALPANPAAIPAIAPHRMSYVRRPTRARMNAPNTAPTQKVEITKCFAKSGTPSAGWVQLIREPGELDPPEESAKT